MSDFVKSASCEGVLMDNLEACMQQGIATSSMAIGAPCNKDPFIRRVCNYSFKHSKTSCFVIDLHVYIYTHIVIVL